MATNGGRDGSGTGGADGQLIVRKEERADAYLTVIQNGRLKRLQGLANAATWLLQGDFLVVATIEYPEILESLKRDVASVVMMEQAKAMAATGPLLITLEGVAMESRLLWNDHARILRLATVREALDVYWAKVKIRVPWMEQTVMNTLRVWMGNGVPGEQTPGFQQWVMEPCQIKERPKLSAALNKIEVLRRNFLSDESKASFMKRASEYFDKEQEVLAEHSMLESLYMKDAGMSRLDRLRMVAHQYVGGLTPKKAWELVCVDERFSDEGEFLAREEHLRNYSPGIQKRRNKLCTAVERLLDLKGLDEEEGSPAEGSDTISN